MLLTVQRPFYTSSDRHSFPLDEKRGRELLVSFQFASETPRSVLFIPSPLRVTGLHHWKKKEILLLTKLFLLKALCFVTLSKLKLSAWLFSHSAIFFCITVKNFCYCRSYSRLTVHICFSFPPPEVREDSAGFSFLLFFSISRLKSKKLPHPFLLCEDVIVTNKFLPLDF